MISVQQHLCQKIHCSSKTEEMRAIFVGIFLSSHLLWFLIMKVIFVSITVNNHFVAKKTIVN